MNAATIKFWMKLLVGIALISALISSLDWSACLEALAGADWRWLIAALIIPVLGVAVSTWKWRLFLRLGAVHETYGRLFLYYWIGCFLNNFFPASTGGDFGRLALLRQSGRLREVAGSIFMERITGIIVLCVAALGGGLVLDQVTWPDFIAGWITPALFLLGGVSGAFFLLLWFSEAFYARLVSWEQPSASRGADKRDHLRKFLLVLLGYFRQHGAIWKGLGITVLFYLLIVILHVFILISLGVDFPLWAPVVMAAVINLIAVIPVSPNGLGLTEWAFVFFYSRVGISPSEAMAAAILARMIGVLASTPAGFLWLWVKNRPTAAEIDESGLR